MKIMGIESSCDETAVAVVEDNRVLSNIVASQHEIHSKFGGVVPELASRKHVEVISTLLRHALKEASVSLKDIDVIAATRAPGLIGALLVGLSSAKAIAFAAKKPLVGVNHLEGHLNAVFLSSKKIEYPHIGLIVSGGHTSIYLVKKFGDYKLLGATRDDAAGEAFDKVARLLELGYPGGPIIDQLAPHGNSKAFKFKKPKFSDHSEFDFSFSGLKTAVMLIYKELKASKKYSEQNKLDLIASFQEAVISSLTENLIKAAKKYKCREIVISGGVAANRGFRARLSETDKREKIKIHIPPSELCTDNAAMIAYVGGQLFKSGKRDNLGINAAAVEEIGQ